MSAINNGGGVVWYATATSTTPLNPNAGLVNGEDYFADSTAGNCGPRPSVVVTIYSAPTGGPFQGVCVSVASEATIPFPGEADPDIEAFGNNIQWYLTPTGGTPLAPGTILNDNTLYYASQTNPNTGCETSRLAVFVNVGIVPTPVGEKNQVFCSSVGGAVPTVANLVATGANNWYLTSTSASALPANTPLIDGQTYYASAIDPPCESIIRLPVTVTLLNPTNAGTSATRRVCANQVASTPPFNLFSLLGGTPDTTGTWTGPVATTNGHLGTVDISSLTLVGSPYVFTYTVESTACAPSSSTVTIEILPLPVVSIAESTTICSGQSATVTFTGTPNATVTYNVNGGASQTIILNASGTASITNTYTATTTINLLNVASSGTPSCSQPQTGSVVITVLPLPVVTISPNVTICSGSSATVTFTGTPNATVTYNINGGPNFTIILNASGTATITNTYTATTTFNLVSVATGGSPSCSQVQTGSSTVTVIQPPVVTISGSTSVCPNGQATVTFTGTPNAMVTYTVNGGANQTITLNASGSATITTTYTVTTTYTLVGVVTSGTPACPQPVSGSVTITVLPLPTATLSAPVTICSGQSAPMTINGTPNAMVTYNINGGASQIITLNASGTATIPGTYTSNTTINLISVASAGTPSCVRPLTASVVITVLPLPTATITATPASVCPGGSATVTITGTPNATVTYTVGGTTQTVILNASGSAVISGTFNATTTYTLTSVATAGTPSCVQPVTGTATITVVPLPTATISGGTITCSGQSAPVTITGTPNAIITYSVNGSTQTITLNASGTATIPGNYTATTVIALVSATTAGTPACTQPLSGNVTITVQPLPTVAISSNVTICVGQSATVTFTGTPNAVVTYNVNGGANETITLSASGTATLTNTYTSTTTFNLVSVATTGTPPCSQPQTGSMTITVLPVPVAVISSDATICSGQTATVTFTGTPNATVTYNINGGASQTIALNGSGTATITNTFTSTTIYNLVSVASPGTPSCVQPISGTITITVIPLPTVTISGTASVCPGGQATITFNGTPNAVVTYTVNGGSSQTITLNASGLATITATFSATTTYTLVSVATTGTPLCSQPQSGSATITVLPPPTATISGTTTVCAGQSATIAFSGTPNAVIAYTVNGGANQNITLNAAGNASITTAFSSTTVYALVSASTQGNPGCSQPVSGTVTVTVTPLPTATISGNADVCPGGSATVTFSGTPNAIVSYTVNGSAAQAIQLDSAGTASVSGTFNVTTDYQLVNVSTQGTPVCQQTVSGSVTITVLPLPTATISAATATICANTSATITFTGTPNATITYSVNGGNQTIVLNGSGTATISPTLVGTTIYSLISASTSGTPACSQPLTGSVTVTVNQPPVAGNDVANFAICATAAPVNLFSLLGTNAQPGGTWSPALASGTGIFNPAVDAAGTYVYTLGGNEPCAPDTASVTVTLIAPPNAGSDASANFCSTQAPQNLFLLLGANAQPGGTWSPALSGGNGIFNPAVDAAGIYTYTVTGAAACGNDSAQVTVTITPAANAGESANAEFCANGAPTDLFTFLGGTPQTGGSWSPALASGTGVFNPAVDAAGTYTYTVSGTSPCENASASVTVAVLPPPNAGADTVANLCSNQDPTNLFLLLGPNAQTGGTWSPTLSSGTGVFNPAVDTAGSYTYTVTGISPCGGDSATVTVTITPGPDAGLDGSLTLCVNSTPQNLFNYLTGTPQTGGTWSPALSGGNGIFNPAVDAPGVYTYTFFGNQPCDNDTATVTVSVNPIPDAGTDGTAFFCTNHPPADLFQSLGGTPQTGGTWTPSLASGTGVFNPLVDAPGTYTYSVGGNLCATSTASVTVTVVQSPNAGGIGATLLINACVTATSVDLFTGLNGTQGVGTWADDDATGALSGNIFNPSAVGAGTYHFTYTVGGGVSPCLFDTATVTVVVSPQPNAGSFSGIQSVCSSAGTFDLSALLDGNQQSGGVWTNSNNDVVDAVLNISGLTAGTYSFTYTINNACGTDAETVQLTILPVPTLTIPNITIVTPICFGSAASLTINGIADGQYTITYNLSGSNTVSNQQVVVTIAGGTGGFTIPSAQIPNIGTTTIEFVSIANNATTCSTTLANVLVNFVVRPLVDLESSNLTAGSACPGNGVTVNISNAVGLTDGNYIFNYVIPNTLPPTGTTGIVTIAGGVGSFTISGASFPTEGQYILTINNIVSLSNDCSNAFEDASVTLTILPSPDASGAVVSAVDTCVNNPTTISISQASGLADGAYEITYQLSGASTATGTEIVTFTSGEATIVIPATAMTNPGTITVSITQLQTSPGACGADVTNFNQTTFEVLDLGTPEIVSEGESFCEKDNPTVADLSANIVGSQDIVWYDAAVGGNQLSESDPLIGGATYFAAFVAESGCESSVRLEVTVDFSRCDDILIPDGFSPNGDGINDDFEIVNLPEMYPKFKLEIYNRYGNILYKGNINTPNWDGTTSEGGVKVGNSAVPAGVYFYILEFNDGTRKPQQGRLYLNR